MSSTEPIHSYKYRLCSQYARSIVISITFILVSFLPYGLCQEVIIIVTFLNAGPSIIALQSYFRTPTHSQTAFILALSWFLHT